VRDETRKKLDLLSWDDRTAVMAVLLATILACAGYLAWTLPYGPPREASGVVRNRWTITKEEMLSRSIKLEILLDDGRYAIATATYRDLPEIGSRVLLRDQTNWLGFHHYFWDGNVSHTDKPGQ